jgi:hypothetical protein
MPKASEALTTSTPSLNRRGLIAAGAAALAGAALPNSPAAAGAFSFSSDFFEIRRLASFIQEVIFTTTSRKPRSRSSRLTSL